MIWKAASGKDKRRFAGLGMLIIWPLLFAVIREMLSLPHWTVWIQLAVPAVGAWLIGRSFQSEREE